MRTFRIYYMEREVAENKSAVLVGDILGSAGGALPPLEVRGEEWEETINAPNERAAIQEFFREHGIARYAVHILEEDGTSREVEDGEPWDPLRTYMWVEDGKLMEFQGMDETAPGMVSCPLCGGEGEVPEAMAQDYEAAQ
jgi:hypothetical protein